MAGLPHNPEQYKMSLGQHLEELRRRVILALLGIGLVTLVCLFFGGSLLRFITDPVRSAVFQLGFESSLVVLTPTEGFMMTIKTAFIVALVISSPWALYQMWLFVAAGLYRHERRIVYVFVPFSAVLFVGGSVFAYTIVLRYGLRFLLAFGGLTNDVIRPTIRLSSAVSFVMMMSVIMGAIFQLPLVMMVLSKIGVIPVEVYVKNWRYAIAGMFLVSAILTPPDPFTQVAMAGPMIGLYWLGVLLAKMTLRKG